MKKLCPAMVRNATKTPLSSTGESTPASCHTTPHATATILMAVSIGWLALAARTSAATAATGTVQFARTTFRVAETQGVARVVVIRDLNTNGAAEVELRSDGGTATANDDYLVVATNVLFAPGERRRIVEVPILDDPLAEGGENLDVHLGNPIGCRLGRITNAVVAIADNELAFYFSREAYLVSEGQWFAIASVLRSGPLNQPAAVDCVALPGSAIPGVHFRPKTNHLVFPRGVAARLAVVPVMDNTVVDADRSVLLSLQNPEGGVALGTVAEALVTITNNDAGGLVEFTSPRWRVSEASGRAVVVIRRRGGMASGVSVPFEMTEGTATPGSDYLPIATNVIFNAGEVFKRIVVPVLRNGETEGEETVNLRLGQPSGGATLGARSTATLVITEPVDPWAIVPWGPPFFSLTAIGVNWPELVHGFQINGQGIPTDSEPGVSQSYSPAYTYGELGLECAFSKQTGSTLPNAAYTLDSDGFYLHGLVVTNTGVYPLTATNSVNCTYICMDSRLGIGVNGSQALWGAVHSGFLIVDGLVRDAAGQPVAISGRFAITFAAINYPGRMVQVTVAFRAAL